MSRAPPIYLPRSVWAAYLCILAALALFLAATGWAWYRGHDAMDRAALESEINRLRSQARHAVGSIERDLELRSDRELADLSGGEWLPEALRPSSVGPGERLFAAVLDSGGTVVLHTDRSKIGGQLPRRWYSRVLSQLGDDVVETSSPVLTSGRPAYDVRVAIEAEGVEVGEYHVGGDVAQFHAMLEKEGHSFSGARGASLAALVLLFGLGVASLYYVAAYGTQLHRARQSAALERTSEVANLAAGLAHEIRNPLHAIQLNLHSLRRSYERGQELPRQELQDMLRQSGAEIERIEKLMQQLLSFAAPPETREEDLDLTTELEAVVEFIQQEMIRNSVEVTTRLPPGSVVVRMDPGRLRQIMLNLLQNAQQAMESGGCIEVSLAASRDQCEVAVADDGPGISDVNRERVFDPFFTTKGEGTGMGLSLVKRFVEETGGDVRHERNPSGGTTIRISLPLARTKR